jgi:predicted peptidase
MPLLAILAFISDAFGQGAFEPKNHKQTIQKEINVSYLLHLPEDYECDHSKKWPVIMFLHGAGERGDNIEKVKVHGPPKIVKHGKKLPFIVIAPQCPSNQIWDNETLITLLDQVLKEHRADPNRVYLTGLSMGGFGTFNLGLAYPDRFAAIAPICGGGDWIKIYAAKGAKPKALESLAVWVFHGEKDGVVLPEQSEIMVNGLKKYGCKEVKFTTYPNAGHDSWTETYDNPELYEWFLSHSR